MEQRVEVLAVEAFAGRRCPEEDDLDLGEMAEGLQLVVGDPTGGVHPVFQDPLVLESQMVVVHLGEGEVGLC